MPALLQQPFTETAHPLGLQPRLDPRSAVPCVTGPTAPQPASTHQRAQQQQPEQQQAVSSSEASWPEPTPAAAVPAAVPPILAAHIHPQPALAAAQGPGQHSQPAAHSSAAGRAKYALPALLRAQPGANQAWSRGYHRVAETGCYRLNDTQQKVTARSCLAPAGAGDTRPDAACCAAGWDHSGPSLQL